MPPNPETAHPPVHHCNTLGPSAPLQYIGSRSGQRRPLGVDLKGASEEITIGGGCSRLGRTSNAIQDTRMRNALLYCNTTVVKIFKIYFMQCNAVVICSKGRLYPQKQMNFGKVSNVRWPSFLFFFEENKIAEFWGRFCIFLWPKLPQYKGKLGTYILKTQKSADSTFQPQIICGKSA